MTKELLNTNTKAEPIVLDINGNIFSTDEEKLTDVHNILSLCLIMLCQVKFPLLLQSQKPFHQLEAYHKQLSVNRQ